MLRRIINHHLVWMSAPGVSGIALMLTISRPHTLPAGRQSATQPAMADAGSFTVTANGARVGREVFTIRQTPGPDPGYTIEGTAVYPTHRLRPALRTDTSGMPVRYQVERLVGDRQEEELTLAISRGHGSERVLTRRGETANQFLVTPGTLLLDDEVYAQYYLIARRLLERGAPIRTFQILSPRRAGLSRAEASAGEDDRVEVAGRTTTALHFHLIVAGEARDLWTDAGGRLLRVAVPEHGIVATRDEAP